MARSKHNGIGYDLINYAVYVRNRFWVKEGL